MVQQRRDVNLPKGIVFLGGGIGEETEQANGKEFSSGGSCACTAPLRRTRSVLMGRGKMSKDALTRRKLRLHCPSPALGTAHGEGSRRRDTKGLAIRLHRAWQMATADGRRQTARGRVSAWRSRTGRCRWRCGSRSSPTTWHDRRRSCSWPRRYAGPRRPSRRSRRSEMAGTGRNCLLASPR